MLLLLSNQSLSGNVVQGLDSESEGVGVTGLLGATTGRVGAAIGVLAVTVGVLGWPRVDFAAAFLPFGRDDLG